MSQQRLSHSDKKLFAGKVRLLSSLVSWDGNTWWKNIVTKMFLIRWHEIKQITHDQENQDTVFTYMRKAKENQRQSVTSQSREFPVPGILLLFGGTGTSTGKNWSRKKVPVPVSEKIGPSTVEFPGTPGHCIF